VKDTRGQDDKWTFKMMMRRKAGPSLSDAIVVLEKVELDLLNLRGAGTTSNIAYLQFETLAEHSLAQAFVRSDVEQLFHTPRFFELVRLTTPGEIMNRLVVAEIGARLEDVSEAVVGLKNRRARLTYSRDHILLPDTNIFLHCKPFDELDWRELAYGEIPHIVVPIVVIEELDRLKRGPATIRQAARDSLKRFHSLGLERSQTAKLKTATIEILEDEIAHERASTADLEILETCSEIQTVSSKSVGIVTSDLSMIVRARASRLTTHEVPSEWERND
jgi:rRNA-processing protein FCF1